MIGGLLLIAGLLAAQAGVIPFLGLMIAVLAPDIFLAGIFFLALGVSRVLGLNLYLAVLMAIVVAIFAGLNTRLLVFYEDFRAGRLSEVQVFSRYEAAVGQPIHVGAKALQISERRYQYSHAMPACYGDSCLVTSGFRMPYPGVERDYWRENVGDVVLAAGFSKANEGERAPILLVTQDDEGLLSTIYFELRDSDGGLISQYRGRYRRGLPFESEDGRGPEGGWNSLVIEYILHGNFISRIAARKISTPREYPLAAFLEVATQLSHPQLALISPYGVVGSAPPSLKVDLEVLEQKEYAPDWVMMGSSGGPSEWSRLSWDKERENQCRSLLRQETPRLRPKTSDFRSWSLFVNDPSGRKKAIYRGPAVCDSGAIWFIDSVVENGRVTLTKYFDNGDFSYRASFERPPDIYGYNGAMLSPTFIAADGYLHFEWWNTSNSGGDVRVRRSMKVRLKEPISPARSAAQDASLDKVTRRP